MKRTALYLLCLILHKPDNTILFAGKVVKPEAAEK